MRLLLPLLLAAAVSLPAAPKTPEAFFGHRMGADFHVLDWERVVAYFHELDAQSDRILVREYGRSTEGRPMIYAAIAAPETLAALERYRGMQKRLADPRRTPAAEAEALAAEGRAVVLITCSIHSTELASTHTAIEYAHRLVTSDDPKSTAIRANTIVLLVPSLNPDGVDIVTRWYRSTLKTPFEGTSPPELYQKYTGHDNNRDWYIFSQAETRATIRELHNAWHPQIVYDVHQQGANGSRLFVPPWMDPIDPNVDPILAQWANALGAGIAADLTSAGLRGISIHSSYDFWTPARHYQAYHGGVRILSESASARLASPITVAAGQLANESTGYSPRRSSWNHLEPWEGGEWRVRNIVEYQLAAFESLLFQAATRRVDLLRSFYKVQKRAVEQTDAPIFVIPKRQTDPAAARRMLETLAFGAVEIEETAENYWIRAAQPFGSFARTLLEPVPYPDLRLYPGGPPKRPYDVTAHHLPSLMGVAVHNAKDPVPASAKRAAAYTFAPERPSPAGTWSAADNASYRRIAQNWKRNLPVFRDPASGNFALRAAPGWQPISQPRIGVYRSPTPAMDEGWTRWLLDTYEWPYSSLTNAEIRSGRLREKFDVLLFPDQPSGTIANGYLAGSMPDGYTGGLGNPGAEALRQFAEQGGTLLFLNRASAYAARALGLEIRNTLEGVSSRDFYCPGSLLHVRLRPGSPLGYGMPERFAIWAESPPAWGPENGVLHYDAPPVLAAGWLLGERYLPGNAALLDLPIGRGRALLFGFRPQYRAQSMQTFKLLFNAMLYR